MIRSGIKRGVSGHVGNCREVEISDAVVGVILQIFHDFRGRVHGLPVDAVVSGHHDRSAHGSGLAENFGEKLRLRGIVLLRHHRRANADEDVFPFGDFVKLVKEGQGFLLGFALRVFRERLRGDADGLHFIACKLKASLGLAQHGQRIRDLLLILDRGPGG